MDKKVFVIILNYNSWEDTIECLESVFQNDYSNLSVIVVDNNSPNGSMNYIKKWAEGKLTEKNIKNGSSSSVSNLINYQFITKISDKQFFKFGKLTLIQSGENKGFAAGNNIALKLILQSKEEGFVFLLNPDMVLEKNTIKNLVEYAENKNTVYGLAVYDYYNPQRLLFLGGAKITPFGTIKFIRGGEKS